MSKKKTQPKKKKQDHSLIISSAIFTCFLILMLGLAFILFKTQPFCANSISCIKDLSGKKETENKGVFAGKTVYAPGLPDTPADFGLRNTKAVLGASMSEYKRIYVDLTNQRLYAFEGNNMIMNTLISSGKWNPTPTGTFRIWIWLRYTRMTGGSGADYYNLPNVPYTMYFYNKTTPKAWGYSLHGTYWHHNFGHPMSHGCVNMKTEDAQTIYYWTNPAAQLVAYPTAENPGTTITIYGRTPVQ